MAVILCGWGCSAPDTSSEPRFPEVTPAVAGRGAPAARFAEVKQRAIAALPKDALLRSKRGLVRVPAGDGVIKLHLGGRFQHATVAVSDGNGQAGTSCIDGIAARDSAGEPPSMDDE